MHSICLLLFSAAFQFNPVQSQMEQNFETTFDGLVYALITAGTFCGYGQLFGQSGHYINFILCVVWVYNLQGFS